jgi:hypothetical protein
MLRDSFSLHTVQVIAPTQGVEGGNMQLACTETRLDAPMLESVTPAGQEGWHCPLHCVDGLHCRPVCWERSSERIVAEVSASHTRRPQNGKFGAMSASGECA